MMDDQSRQNIADIESLFGKPTGIGKIERGECELGGATPMACMFCSYGHMLECHYPYTCEEAECSHYQQEMAAEGYPYEEER